MLWYLPTARDVVPKMCPHTRAHAVMQGPSERQQGPREGSTAVRKFGARLRGMASPGEAQAVAPLLRGIGNILEPRSGLEKPNLTWGSQRALKGQHEIWGLQVPPLNFTGSQSSQRARGSHPEKEP